MSITAKQILDALSHVDDPDLNKDLVTLGMIKHIEIEGKEVRFDVVLTTPACPMKENIKKACITAVKHFVDQGLEVIPKMTSNVQAINASEVIPHVKNVIAVASGKGGVGKSTVAVNLALSLNAFGAKVGLFDADVYGPSIPTMLGIKDQKPESVNDQIQPLEKEGLKVMSIGFLVPPEQAVVWRGPMASSAIKQFGADVAWGELDYLIVDLPPGTGDIHLTVLQGMPVTGAVVITTPQEVALADCRKAISMFNMQGINTPILGVIENMAWFSPPDLPNRQYHIFGEGGGQKLAKESDLPFLGELPLEMELGKDADKGLTYDALKKSGVDQYFTEITGKIVQQIAIQKAKG